MSIDLNDPRTFHVAQDRDGFYIADDEGEPVDFSRYSNHADAVEAIGEMVAEAADIRRQEEDGPTDDQVMNGPGMEGGVRYRT